MKRWQRNLLLRLAARTFDLADALTRAAEALQEWVWTKTQRPRPLCFPSELQLQMDAMLQQTMARLAESYANDLLYGDARMFGQGMVRVADDGARLTVNRISMEGTAYGDRD